MMGASRLACAIDRDAAPADGGGGAVRSWPFRLRGAEAEESVMLRSIARHLNVSPSAVADDQSWEVRCSVFQLRTLCAASAPNP